MDNKQKIATTFLWGILVVAMTSIIATGLWTRLRPGPDVVRAAALPAIFDAPRFVLTDQDSRHFSSDQLIGRPYVATFIFTNCSTACPMITQQMATLQKTVKDAQVSLISFTVDPARDTPEALKEYAKRFNADSSRWHFLTGTQPMLDEVQRGMNVKTIKAEDGSDQFMHTRTFFLIDGEGKVRGLYSSQVQAELDKLAGDAAALARAGKAGRS